MNWKRVLIGKWSWKRPFISLLWIYVLLGVVAVFFGDRLLFVPSFMDGKFRTGHPGQEKFLFGSQWLRGRLRTWAR